MIDTAKLYVPLTDRLCRKLRAAREANSPIIKIYNGCYFFLKHPYQAQSIKVNFDLEKKHFCLETSLPKVLQGHNVFGSNRLEMLCFKVIERVYAQFCVEFTLEEQAAIRKKGIRLGRLDITCSFRLASPAMVDLVLEQLSEHFRAEGEDLSVYSRSGVETIYVRPRSTRVTDKFYNKHKELLANGRGIPESAHMRDKILRMSRNLLRYEVTLRGKELTRRELNYADCWNVERVKEELVARLRQFDLQGVVQSSMAVDDIPDLSDSCRTFYQLWAGGADLSEYRHYRTLDRARKTLLEQYQVDIYRRPERLSPVGLKEILDHQRAYFCAPKSVVRAGAIFTD